MWPEGGDLVKIFVKQVSKNSGVYIYISFFKDLNFQKLTLSIIVILFLKIILARMCSSSATVPKLYIKHKLILCVLVNHKNWKQSTYFKAVYIMGTCFQSFYLNLLFFIKIENIQKF